MITPSSIGTVEVVFGRHNCSDDVLVGHSCRRKPNDLVEPFIGAASCQGAPNGLLCQTRDIQALSLSPLCQLVG